MKTVLLFLAVMFAACTSPAQQNEFAIHDNGLIYSEETMNRLGKIVDSLNIKFRACEPKNFRSLAQGYVTVIDIQKDAKKIKSVISDKIAPDQLAEMVPNLSMRKLWIVKSRYEDYNGKRMVRYASLPRPKNEDNVEFDLPRRASADKTTGWVVVDEYSKILYLHGISEQPLEQEYARLVQYVDCMIDTSAKIYTTEKSTESYFKEDPRSKASEFIKWAAKFPDEPKYPEVDGDSPYATTQYEKYYRDYESWNNKRLAALDKKMKNDVYHRSLLMEAAEEAIEAQLSSYQLELYVERYASPKQALELKRSRKPIGMCSMDQTPRFHAASICRLAAETAQWDIFLRAHLDIMNDRFDRASDGSYAWAGRGTYLQEIEKLDINAIDLLIGTVLRSSNTSTNHYFGNISRIGRALSETSFKNELENRLLKMVRDEKLDTYNRLLIAYLFKNYNYFLEDEVRKKTNDERFALAAMSLPFDLAKSLEKW